MFLRAVSVAAPLLAVLVDAAAAPGLVKWSGGKTPMLELLDAEGRSHALPDWKGKTVVVNFWATWCEPCREEMPSLERLKARLPEKAFQVVAVNVGESPERVARFTREVPVSFPILFDRQRETARSWQVRGYPTSYVLGPDGRIRYYFVGELDWAREDIVRTIQGVR
jgi:thiol-disulfide isomerase/thioredoxin